VTETQNDPPVISSIPGPLVAFQEELKALEQTLAMTMPMLKDVIQLGADLHGSVRAAPVRWAALPGLPGIVSEDGPARIVASPVASSVQQWSIPRSTTPSIARPGSPMLPSRSATMRGVGAISPSSPNLTGKISVEPTGIRSEVPLPPTKGEMPAAAPISNAGDRPAPTPLAPINTSVVMDLPRYIPSTFTLNESASPQGTKPPRTASEATAGSVDPTTADASPSVPGSILIGSVAPTAYINAAQSTSADLPSAEAAMSGSRSAPGAASPVRGAGNVDISDREIGTAGPALQSDAAPEPREGMLIIDGAQLGRWVIDHLARQASRPMAGMTGIDPRMNPTFPGAPTGA
jgi:hypothetical protein